MCNFSRKRKTSWISARFSKQQSFHRPRIVGFERCSLTKTSQFLLQSHNEIGQPSDEKDLCSQVPPTHTHFPQILVQSQQPWPRERMMASETTSQRQRVEEGSCQIQRVLEGKLKCWTKTQFFPDQDKKFPVLGMEHSFIYPIRL